MSSSTEKPRLDGGELKKNLQRRLDARCLSEIFDISNFDHNALLRGMQLTLVGAHRALQNPALFTSEHYRQAAFAVLVGIGIRAIVSIPILLVKTLLWALSFVYKLESVTWDNTLLEGLDFFAIYVLQVPFFLMTLMRHIVPTLDKLFMQSLLWVDETYIQKHKHDKPNNLRPMYHANLNLYTAAAAKPSPQSNSQGGLSNVLVRSTRKGLLSMIVFGLSYLPVIGSYVLPAASFHTFYRAVGMGPAFIIFGTGIFLPRRYLVIFLQSYFSSRSLMRELLEPYFARVHFTKEEKRNWFRSREGVLFGFGLGFYMLIKVPLMGVLIYGIAEAATAYLLTKVSDPPPPPSEMRSYATSQQIWSNKHEFLSISLANIDS